MCRGVTASQSSLVCPCGLAVCTATLPSLSFAYSSLANLRPQPGICGAAIKPLATRPTGSTQMSRRVGGERVPPSPFYESTSAACFTSHSAVEEKATVPGNGATGWQHLAAPPKSPYSHSHGHCQVNLPGVGLPSQLDAFSSALSTHQSCTIIWVAAFFESFTLLFSPNCFSKIVDLLFAFFIVRHCLVDWFC